MKSTCDAMAMPNCYLPLAMLLQQPHPLETPVEYNPNIGGDTRWLEGEGSWALVARTAAAVSANEPGKIAQLIALICSSRH